MANKTIVSAGSTATSGYFDSLATVTAEQINANAASGKRMLGRTAIALEKLTHETRESAHQEGFAAGFDEGLKAGLNQAEAEYAEHTRAFAETLQAKADQALFAMAEWVEKSEQNLAELAVEIATRILSQELRLPHDTITSITKEALAEVRLAESARIRINPFDHPDVEARKAELLAISSQLRRVEIVDDESIQGGCVIESDAGIIDATIQTRLELTLDSIKEAA